MNSDDLTVESKPQHVAALAVAGMIESFRTRLPGMDPEKYGGPEFIRAVIRELDALELVVEFYGHASREALQEFIALVDRHDHRSEAEEHNAPA